MNEPTSAEPAAATPVSAASPALRELEPPAAPAPGSAATPQIDGALLAVVVAAVDQVWPRRRVAEPEPSGLSAWRFSGRWWSRPTVSRRDRPFA